MVNKNGGWVVWFSTVSQRLGVVSMAMESIRIFSSHDVACWPTSIRGSECPYKGVGQGTLLHQGTLEVHREHSSTVQCTSSRASVTTCWSVVWLQFPQHHNTYSLCLLPLVFSRHKQCHLPFVHLSLSLSLSISHLSHSAFKASRPNARTYFFQPDSSEEMMKWVKNQFHWCRIATAIHLAAVLNYK